VHSYEVNHTNVDDGILGEDDSTYIRSTTYSWFDAADRIIARADYGTGASSWSYSTVPEREVAPLTWTDEDVFDGRALLTTYGYDNDTGRQELVTTGIKKNGSNTTTAGTKTFYDDLSRRLFVVEN